MQTLKPMPPVLRALQQLILDLDTEVPVDPDWVGGDFRFDPEAMPWYIQLARAAGRSGQLEGDHVVDVDVFATEYHLAESLAFALEALALGYPHVVEVDDRKVVFDEVYQNSGPAELPWEDDNVFRVGATYSITVRR